MIFLSFVKGIYIKSCLSLEYSNPQKLSKRENSFKMWLGTVLFIQKMIVTFIFVITVIMIMLKKQKRVNDSL